MTDNIKKIDSIKELQQQIENLVEEGNEDTAAWEYRASLLDAIKRIKNGEDIDSVMSNI